MGVLGEDKHLWGSQLLNNSERETCSTQCRGGALSGQLIHCRGELEVRERERERRVDKDSMTEEDITVEEPVCV